MQSRKSNENRRASFQGQVEVLEGRALLSCTVHEHLGILSITGSGAADTVRVADLGSNATGSITVKCNNGPANAVVPVASNIGPISKISINTGGGDDLAKYDLGVGATLVVPRIVTINVGPGNNIAKVGAGQATINANLSIKMTSGNGNDILGVSAAAGIDPALGFVPTVITAGHSLSATVNAGLGNDKVSVAADGATINGAMVFNGKAGAGTDKLVATAVDAVLGAGGLLSLSLDGGPGADLLEVTAGVALDPATGLPQAGADSQVKISLLGSDQNDTLTLAYTGLAPVTALLVDGGLGTDTCTVPAGLLPPVLTVIGCEIIAPPAVP